MDDPSSPAPAENKPPSANKAPKQTRPAPPAKGKPASNNTLKQSQRSKTGAPPAKRATKPVVVASMPEAAPARSQPAAEEATPPDGAAPHKEPASAEEIPASSPLTAEETMTPPAAPAAPGEPSPAASAAPANEAPASSPPADENEAAPAAEAAAPVEAPPESSAPAADGTAAPSTEQETPAPKEPATPKAAPAPIGRISTIFRRLGAGIGIVGALLAGSGVFLPYYGSGDYEQAALQHTPYGLWIVVGLLLAPAFIILISHLFAWFIRPPLWLVVLCCLLVILVVWVHWLVEALFVGLSCFDACPPGGIHYGTGYWLPLIGFPASGLGILIAAIASIRWRSKRRAQIT